jgi:ribosomal-protein-alanine N-acetyltransferase
MESYNAKECYLEVRESNIAAINLYKKLAFKQAKTIKNYYADGENAIVMAQKLSNSHM